MRYSSAFCIWLHRFQPGKFAAAGSQPRERAGSLVMSAIGFCMMAYRGVLIAGAF